jgi:hypothetical protein
MERLIRLMELAGWRVKKGKHYKMLCPCGDHMLVMQKTPADYRGVRNAKQALKRTCYGKIRK